MQTTACSSRPICSQPDERALVFGPPRQWSDAAMLIDEIGLANLEEVLDLLEEAKGHTQFIGLGGHTWVWAGVTECERFQRG